MPETGVYLGFDFGMRRIGVAIGQSISGTASALTVLQAQDGVPQWSLLDQLLRTWQPLRLVVGIPLHMDGCESAMTLNARSFCRKLTKRYALPVHGMDERLTSEEAASIQRDRKVRSPGLDADAAALVLQSYLDSLKTPH